MNISEELCYCREDPFAHFRVASAFGVLQIGNLTDCKTNCFSLKITKNVNVCVFRIVGFLGEGICFIYWGRKFVLAEAANAPHQTLFGR